MHPLVYRAFYFMANELTWFKFSPFSWMTGRIRKESAKVQIAFIEIICQYWKNEGQMTIEQAELEVGDSIHKLLDRRIIKADGNNIKIHFIDEQIQDIGVTSELRRSAALSRWKQKQSKTMQVHASALQSDADREIDRKKRKKEKIEIPFEGDLLAVWNEWIEYRKERKLPTSLTSQKKQIQFLAGRGADEVKEILNASIRNNWQGLFELKQHSNGKRNTTEGSIRRADATIQGGREFGEL